MIGVELGEDYARDAEARLDRVIVADAQAFATEAGAAGSAVRLSDLRRRARAHARPVGDVARCSGDARAGRRGGRLAAQRRVLGRSAALLRTRRWPREDEGLFDRTHLRWFGEADAIELLEQAGLRDVTVHPKYWVEGAALRRRQWLARTPLRPYLAPQHVLTAVKG